jgi:hypothetical protein
VKTFKKFFVLGNHIDIRQHFHEILPLMEHLEDLGNIEVDPERGLIYLYKKKSKDLSGRIEIGKIKMKEAEVG